MLINAENPYLFKSEVGPFRMKATNCEARMRKAEND
jgi:hypothetical protein